jgi:hypothetical protein
LAERPWETILRGAEMSQKGFKINPESHQNGAKMMPKSDKHRWSNLTSCFGKVSEEVLAPKMDALATRSLKTTSAISILNENRAVVLPSR